MPMGLGATVDYIFYSAEPVENKAGECGSAGLIPVTLGEDCETGQMGSAVDLQDLSLK